MSGGRSVAVLGPIPRDRITTHRGEVFEKYGCALYTVAALSALLDDDDRIYPIVHVRREDEEPVKQLLSQFPNVDLTGVRSTTDHGAVVELTYVDQNTRIEQQTGFMAPITPADVEFALHADSFVCVPITDYEVGQATLAYIKGHSDGTILLDAHGPTSTLVMGGERRRRLWVERDTWLPHVDILKMNLEEAGCSWFPSRIALEHHDAGAPISTELLPEFAEHSLRHGVKALCVTLDERGCVVYRLDEAGEPGRADRARDPGRARRRHHRRRRLLRRRHGVRLPAGPRRRARSPVRQRHGRAALHRLGAQRLPPARGDEQADRPHLRERRSEPDVRRRTRRDDSWLVEQSGFDPWRARTSTRRSSRSATGGSAPAGAWRRGTSAAVGHFPGRRLRQLRRAGDRPRQRP